MNNTIILTCILTLYFEANSLKFFISSIEHVMANRGVMTGWTLGY